MTEDLVINVAGMTKTFDGRTVVDDVDLQVRAGQVCGFLGPNGSGKTTFIRMLCGLLRPDAGRGTCLGYDVIDESEAIKRNVRYMTQRFSLYEDLTISENLDFVARMYSVKNRRKAVRDALDRLGLEDRRRQLAGELSGGWKQRLALAACLIHEPKPLLLDEPTAGVDPQARREFWDQIHQLAGQGLTFLISTHYMDEVERCHRLAYILNGVLLAHGTVGEIVSETNLTTWEADGPDLLQLAEKLRNSPGVEQAVHFGNLLHVSGADPGALEKAIEPFHAGKYNLLDRGEVQFVVNIPVNFTHDLLRGDKPVLLLEADATDPAATSNAIGSLRTLLNTALQDDLKGALSFLAGAEGPVDLRVQARYNPESITQYNVVPGLMGVVLQMTMTVITGLAITRERERGTMETLLSMPTRPIEVMTGKIVPYILMGYIQVTLILSISYFLFRVPIAGSVWLLFAAALVFIIATLAVAITFSTLAENQLQAAQVGYFFFLPSMLLSGFMFPFRGMPDWAQKIGELLASDSFPAHNQGNPA